jgi:restriction endonuclease
MDKDKILDIVTNVKNRSNKDLFESRDELYNEFEKTKDLIIKLTKHLDTVQEYYEKINTEIGNRLKK